MSEYWKSTPKYWCKHCSTYVKDTPFERKQHENTGKHQGNLKRFLRGIQNDHEKNEREKEQAKAEINRLNKVVGGKTVSMGSSATKSTTSCKTPATPSNAADQKRQWAQLAEMGIEVPENFRAQMAMPGQWQATATPIEDPNILDTTLNFGVRKRNIDEQEEVEEDSVPATRRGWGFTTRRYPGDDDQDLDALLGETLVRTDSPATNLASKREEVAGSTATEKEPVLSHEDDTDVLHALHSKVESTSKPIYDDDQKQLKSEAKGDGEDKTPLETLDVSVAPVFKKRKAKLKAGREVE